MKYECGSVQSPSNQMSKIGGVSNIWGAVPAAPTWLLVYNPPHVPGWFP